MTAGAEGRSRSARAESARANRLRMLEAARRLFVERGYVATTIEAIAREAGMAVQTIYFTFGNKRTVLKELIDISVAGDDAPVPTLERPWFLAVLAEPDPEAKLRLFVHNAASISERVGEVLEVVRSAAASDPEIAEQWETNKRQRRTVHKRLAESLAAVDGLRPGLGEERAADIAFAVLSPELRSTLVRDCGWATTDWEEWAAGVLCQLLP